MIRNIPIAVKDVLYHETIHEAPDAEQLNGLLF